MSDIECNDSWNFQLYRFASHSIIDFLFSNHHYEPSLVLLNAKILQLHHWHFDWFRAFGIHFQSMVKCKLLTPKMHQFHGNGVFSWPKCINRLPFFKKLITKLYSNRFCCIINFDQSLLVQRLKLWNASFQTPQKFISSLKLQNSPYNMWYCCLEKKLSVFELTIRLFLCASEPFYSASVLLKIRMKVTIVWIVAQGVSQFFLYFIQLISFILFYYCIKSGE